MRNLITSIGCAYLCVILGFWGLIGWVAFHFISKFW